MYKNGDKIIIVNPWEPENYSKGDIFTIIEETEIEGCYRCLEEHGKYTQYLDVAEFKLYDEKGE
jgi:hypothetical protein